MRGPAAVAVLAVVLLTAWRLALRDRQTTSYDIPGTRMPYAVEVLNGAGADGLARTVTLRLRRSGFDVVSYGTAPMSDQDSTLVLLRRGDSAAALAVRDALGFGRVVVEPDARLLVDVTVLLGDDAAH